MQLWNKTSKRWVEGPESWLEAFDNHDVVDDDGNGPTGPGEAETGLDKLKLPELKVAAADAGVDVTGLRSKADIIAAIRDHEAAHATGGESLDPDGDAADA